ncbi:MAG: PQQ-binding-like beta-propeller repeat protein [Planctomycetes bacterium]|nr:PQQ-binding-like beta-propeller repeat protein [Planctomycetota bacterium]
MTHDAEKVLCTLEQSIQTEMLPNGNLLTASYALQSVREVRSDGSELWAKGGLEAVVDCQRLPDGNTLVCRHTWHLVQELKPDGEQAWSTKTKGPLLDVDRLPNGNTLATQFGTGGVIEIDRDGKTVWSFDGSELTSAARQLDGTTLITNTKSGHVLQVEPGGEVLRTWKCRDPWHAELLPSGHMVVNERQAVRILDANGKTVWSLERSNILGMQVLGAGPHRANATPPNVAPATPPQPK